VNECRYEAGNEVYGESARPQWSLQRPPLGELEDDWRHRGPCPPACALLNEYAAEWWVTPFHHLEEYRFHTGEYAGDTPERDEQRCAARAAGKHAARTV
jgi:hypothetical protein